MIYENGLDGRTGIIILELRHICIAYQKNLHRGPGFCADQFGDSCWLLELQEQRDKYRFTELQVNIQKRQEHTNFNQPLATTLTLWALRINRSEGGYGSWRWCRLAYLENLARVWGIQWLCDLQCPGLYVPAIHPSKRSHTSPSKRWSSRLSRTWFSGTEGTNIASLGTRKDADTGCTRWSRTWKAEELSLPV